MCSPFGAIFYGDEMTIFGGICGRLRVSVSPLDGISPSSLLLAS
jgi:hypothetical protein